MEAAESVHFSVVDAWENRPFETLGPVWWPTYLQVDSDKSYPVHRFGSRPLARLNVYAEAGCCPHLSVDHGAGEFTLLASVLINGNSPFRARKSAVVLPVAVTNIKISEDDDYFTVMFCISISKAGNTLQLRGPSLLFRGQSLDLHVPEGFRGGTLSIRGFYLG